MKFFIISVVFIALCIELIAAQREYTFTLDQPFQSNVFIPYYSQGTKSLAALPTNDVIVSDTSLITFKLTNGVLSSPANDATYYLKKQTGSRYPSYALKQGQPMPGDVSVFKASPNSELFGRSLAPNITTDVVPGPANLWVACKNSDNIYTIGWHEDLTTTVPEGCVSYATYYPGVILHVNFV